jgi:plastocyanin
VVAALCLAALTACSSGSSAVSGSSSGGGSPPAGTAITATEQDFSIQLDSTQLAAGAYTITVKNEGNATHDLVIEQDGNDIAGTDSSIPPGGSGSFTVMLDPGTYVFYCSIGNHRARGMEIDVTVT